MAYDGYGAYLDQALKARKTQASVTNQAQPNQSGWILNDKSINYNPYPSFSPFGGREQDNQVVPGDWNDRLNYYTTQRDRALKMGLSPYDPNNPNTAYTNNLKNIDLGFNSLQQEQAGQLRQGYMGNLDPTYDMVDQANKDRAMREYQAYQRGYMSLDMLNRSLGEIGVGALPAEFMANVQPGSGGQIQKNLTPGTPEWADAVSRGYMVPTEAERNAQAAATPGNGGGYGTMGIGGSTSPAATATGASSSFTPGPYYQANIAGQSALPSAAPTSAGGSMISPYPFNSNLSDIPPEIQREVLRQRAEAQLAQSSYGASRQAGRGSLESGLQQSAQSALSSSIPGIETRLQQLGIAQSGAYPEALAKRQQEIYNQSILPQLSAYDMTTQDNMSQLPLLALGNEQALRTGGINRGYALSDSAAQMAYYNQLADKQAKQNELSSLLGIVPSAIGLMGTGGGGGFGGLFGGGMGVAGYGGAAGGGFGPGVGPSGQLTQGYYTPGGQFVPGSSGPATMANVGWLDRMNAGKGNFGAVAGGAAGGGLGAYLGQKYLGDLLGGSKTSRQIGSGVGAAGLAYLMGAGLPGLVGAGVGGGLFGTGGGALGGAAGGGLSWLNA